MIATQLPIEPVLPALHAALQEHPIVIVQADPGAGKSTVLPLSLLDQPWLGSRRIVMLEPRRQATRAVARRMASLLGENTGRRVGYRMRLDTCVSRDTRIEVVTEGILTRRLQNDPALEDVACVIFDEFHERSLNADLGLALCLDAQAGLREDLKLIIMSATLDTAALSDFLGGAPVISAAGRSFPVDTRHLPRGGGRRIEADVTAAVLRALREDGGDLLVFLPGRGEIERIRQNLAQHVMATGIEVLPLYGDLPAAEQDKALTPANAGLRKVVLATSIAETSLTIEGVSVVIDSGLARRARFDPRSGMTRLETLTVTRAAADQRRGRAGRLGPGTCYRLWSPATEQQLAAFTPPEILEADLCPLVLEVANWGAERPQQLRWMTAPPAAAWTQASELLQWLGALDERGRITPAGREMAGLGMHPRLARMLLEARGLGLSVLGCEIAAILSGRDMLRMPPGMRHADLHWRLEALRRGAGALPAGIDVMGGLRAQVAKLARDWQRQFGGGDRGASGGDDEQLGVLLAHAYPDRIARRRDGDGGRYLLSNGRGATLPQGDPLAREPWLVVADLDAGEREARIYLAAPISREQIERHLGAQIREHESIAWDSRSQSVAARRERRYGALVLAESAIERHDPALAVAAMIAGIREMGLQALPWNAASRGLRARMEFIRTLEGAASDWPEVSDENLEATLEQWLAPWLSGITRRDHLARLDLNQALLALLSWDRQKQLETLAPTHVEVPSGSRIALDYSGDQPALAVRLQEVFGMQDTPRVGGGRVPVTMQLLSPARRPVQTTRDLKSFWERGYHEVRKELKGRYPKHYWPDDPHAAEPTRRVRPR